LEAQKKDVEAEGVEDGISLVMKKVLLKPKLKIGRPTQRNNLFRTAYKMKDRVCKVIIDSGSTNKLVSTEMVDNLEMGMNAHPTPYKVSWLQKVLEVTVIKQCLV
jgi:hypothetical protein